MDPRETVLNTPLRNLLENGRSEYSTKIQENHQIDIKHEQSCRFTDWYQYCFQKSCFSKTPLGNCYWCLLARTLIQVAFN